MQRVSSDQQRARVGKLAGAVIVKGFDPEFKDLPDYTLGITRAIWEDRGVGPALKRFYADDVIVRAPTGLQLGNGEVTATTLGTLHEFPDRKLVGEDVVWYGEESSGFLSSHRLISVMRHTGNGSFGEATGRIVRSRIIADCVISENQVREEWLVRDQAAFANCLGLSSRELAEAQYSRETRDGGAPKYFLPENDKVGTFVPRLDRDDPSVSLVCDSLEAIWQDKQPASLRSNYHEGCIVFPPGGGTRHGHVDLDEFFVAYLASFPDAKVRIASGFCNRKPNTFDKVAVRFEVKATHSGWGHFGEPTGAPIYIMGLSHAYVSDGRIVLEWLAIDEVPIWKQIFHHCAAH